MIELKNVTKYYGKKKAVDDLSLTINEGEICVLLGKSGCGKSTTLRMINRLIEPTEGEIYVNNKNIKDYVPEDLRRKIGYVVQGIGLFPYMTVERNISIVPQLLKWDKDRIHKRALEMMELVGLNPDEYLSKYPSELSGGEAQRIGVARALAADPDIVLMDEPFGAVDPINRQRLQTEFLKIQRELNKTIIFVTHDLEEALKMGDKIAIMENGVLQNCDTPEKLLEGKNKEFVSTFLGKDYFLKLLSRYKVGDILRDKLSEGSDNAANLSVENTDDPTYLTESDTLQAALSMMIYHHIDRCIVKNSDGTVIGCIDWDDIMKCLNRE